MKGRRWLCWRLQYVKKLTSTEMDWYEWASKVFTSWYTAAPIEARQTMSVNMWIHTSCTCTVPKVSALGNRHILTKMLAIL